MHRPRIVTNDERRFLRFGGVEVERAPGLAPGKGGVAIRRLDGFGIARFGFGVTAGIRTRIFWFTARNSDS